ncbi:MAG: PEP-CTERM sorting domain-containing protein [Armatimonadetes bacterium]|nr:PEP-CTERM sorting domain-containing protein [Armatimonadota bacterium]
MKRVSTVFQNGVARFARVGSVVSASLLLATAGWSQTPTLTWLGTLPGGNYCQAYGVSGDGSVVVGTSGGRAFRWTPNRGMEDLNRTYAHLLTPGSSLYWANAISPDGRYIVGGGLNAATWRDEAFLLDTIPEPASLMALGAGLAGLLGLRRRKQ